MSTDVDLSIVIAFYNEEANVAQMLAAVRRVLQPLALRFEFVLIDDGSRDQTWPLIQQQAADDPHLRAIRFSRNFGKEAALFAGLNLASGKAAVTMDGDLQHPPELIPQMVKQWRERGVQVLEAVKNDRGKESLFSKLSARVFYGVLRRVSGLDLRNASDFKLLDRVVIDSLKHIREVNLFYRGLSEWVGFSRGQIFFDVPSRRQGASRWSKRALMRLALTGITSFSALPLHLISSAGVIFFLLSILGIVHTLYQKISGNAVSGFATVIILLLIIGSVLMIGLGIIGIYLARIYDEVKQRPQYVVRERL